MKYIESKHIRQHTIWEYKQVKVKKGQKTRYENVKGSSI